jgi:hypothetical protein
MNTIHVLYLVLAIGSSSSTSQHPLTGMTAEHRSLEACTKAAESIRTKINKAYIVLLTCEAK